MDPDKLVALLTNGHLWMVLGVAFGFGALGALIHRGSSSDTAQAGRPPGLAPDVLTGGIAAMAILYVSDPATAAALIGGSLVAGYAAKSVLAGLEARVTSVIAQRDASDSKRQADAAKRALESLAAGVSALPEAAQSAPGDHVTRIKQLAQSMTAQLSLQ